MKDLFDLHPKINPSFEEAYQGLNIAQKKAVDSIEGPVMVIAGPGTGKTQILSIRIGNILKKTDCDPKSILCLTYTEAGAKAMRDRLQKFIGATAYDVGIYTFHSFCNLIIRENPEEFGLFGNFDLASDLDLNNIATDITKSFQKDHPLYNYKNNYAYTIYNILKLIQLIKQENWDPNKIIDDYKKEIISSKDSDIYIYKQNRGNNKKGDFNENLYKKDTDKLKRYIAFFECFEKYQESLRTKELFDFHDMLKWVLEKFKNDDTFLAKYQERFLYYLVDEYQDTNGIQNEIIYQLNSYFDSSNIFVVGDDDQAIYRFQGAKMDNMIEFNAKYKPEIIILTDNYRSSQHILNAAGYSIQNNIERLINIRTDLNKDLTAAGKNKAYNDQVKIIEYYNFEAEVVGVCQQIKSNIDNGIEPKEMAILYKKNNEADSYVKYLQALKIPYSVSKEVNVLQETIIKQIIKLLDFIQKAQRSPFANDDILFEILHFPYIEFSVIDIGILSRHLSPFENKESLLELLNNKTILTELKLQNTEYCSVFYTIIMELIENFNSLTAQVFIEKLLHDLQILKYIVNHPDKIHLLNVLNRFFDYIKKESTKNPNLSMSNVISDIEQMQNNNLSLSLYQAIGTKNGVQLSTLYKSKGLEYDYVYMINNTAANWKSVERSPVVLPEHIKRSDIANDEDIRRLFYVGMTRAKQSLSISYPKETIDAKNAEPSKYVSELKADEKVIFDFQKIDDELVANMLVAEMSSLKKDFTILNDEWLDSFLENYRLSPTAMDKYLRCPVAFYYENILRVPSARTSPFGFGRAIHESLHQFIQKHRTDAKADVERYKEYYIDSMKKYKSHFTTAEYEGYYNKGLENIPEFLLTYWDQWRHAENMQFEIKKKEAHYKEVPISGQLDRIDFLGNQITVIDYKTGNSSGAKSKVKAPDAKNPDGTDYWRQMIFYAILLDYYPEYRNKQFRGIFYFVLKDQNTFHQVEVISTDESKEKVGELIVDVYQNIKAKKFSPGCGDKDCLWCSYLNTGANLKLVDKTDEEEDL